MKTRTLSRGMVEVYNQHLRIRLHLLPGEDTALVTIYRLKPNGYCSAKRTLRVQQPVSLQEVLEFCGIFAEEG